MQIEPTDAPLGAVVRGLELDVTCEAGTVAALTAALATHAVLIVRGTALTSTQLQSFASAFGSIGPLEESSNVNPDGSLAAADSPKLAGLVQRQRWRSAGSFLPDPPRISMTYAATVPQRGGQTQFADMRKALRLLPTDDRTEMDQLELAHRDGDNEARHPWIQRAHDGTPYLYMGAHASHIVDRDHDTSREWFAEIEAQLPVHDVIYEHRWLANDLVIAD